MDMDEYILKNVMKILSWIVKCKNVKCHIELSCKVLLDMYRFRIYRWQKACKQVKCLFPLIRRYCKKWGNDNDWIGTQTRDLCYLVRSYYEISDVFLTFLTILIYMPGKCQNQRHYENWKFATSSSFLAWF